MIPLYFYSPSTKIYSSVGEVEQKKDIPSKNIE